MDDEVTATSDTRDLTLDRLREWRALFGQRDPLVCDAKRAGHTYTQIMDASGLAKATVNAILDRAGLTGPQPNPPDDPMTTATAARFFPHHPNFLSVDRTGLTSAKYTFRAFTGTEPEPTYPDFPGPMTLEEEQTDDEKAMWAEYRDRGHEIDAATKCWQEARYHRQVTPLVEAACKARQPVDLALAEMDAAWHALDSALVWPVAVKHLLDAHEKARAAMQRWVNDCARPLAEAEGTQPNYIREYVADWRRIAQELGYDTSWDIGWYYKGDHHVRASYDASPLDDLDRTIATHRAKLEEIAKYSKRDDNND